MEADVKKIFNDYPPEFRKPLLELRTLIYDVAAKIAELGEIEESLKWGQPTYSTVRPKIGSPIRIDRFEDDKIALFFHCQTSLVSTFRSLFEGKQQLDFSKNRTIVLDPSIPLPVNELALCIEMALTYYLRTKGNYQ